MKATTEDFLKLNTLRGTKTAFLTRLQPPPPRDWSPTDSPYTLQETEQ